MSIDNTKLRYSSSWDIDQLIASDTMTVPNGDTAIYTFTDDPPVFEVQFQPTSSNAWYSPGTSSTNGQFANTFSWYAYINNSKLYISCSGGKARYFIWGDKVNY